MRLIVIVSDFVLVRKCKGYNVYNLYKPHGLYWYTRGWNPRAIIAFLVGMVPLLPGLFHNINSNIRVSQGTLDFYTLAWLDGVIFSG